MRSLIPATFLLIASAALPVLASGQQLPPASRTVYKCKVGTKVSYSDAPCLGAEKLEIEPTRGLDSISGRRVVGTDVQRERHRETVAEILRPLTGKDAKELDQHGRRMRLSQEVQRECVALDKSMLAAEREENAASGAERKEVQVQLFAMRSRYRELQC